MSLILTSARVARYASQTLLRNAFAASLYGTTVVKTGGSGSVSSPAGMATKNPAVEGAVLPVVASGPAAIEVAASAETSLTPKPKRGRPAKNEAAGAGAESKPKKEKPEKNAAAAESKPKKEKPEKNAAAESKPKKEKPAKNAAAAAVAKPKKEKSAKNTAASAATKPKKEKPAKSAAAAVTNPKKEKPAKNVAAAEAKPKKEKPAKNATAAMAKLKKEKPATNAAAAKGKPTSGRPSKNAVAAVAKPKRGRPAKNAVAVVKAKPKKEKPAKKSKLVGAKGVRKAALKKKVKKVTKKAAKPKEMRHSAYNLFLKEVFPTIQAASIVEKMKVASAKWKELSVDAKLAYARRSQSDEGLKKRRLTAIALYVKENYATVQSLSKLVEQWKALGSEEKAKYSERAAKGEGAKVLKAKSKAKATKAPRALSGYLSYIKQVYPTLTGTATDRIKFAASQWKNLSPEAKSAYQSPKAPVAAKRAPTCGYQLFLQEKTKGVTPVVTIVTAATQWKAMSDAQKQEYNVKAKRV